MTREDRKAEEALKALLKLPANKRCINCDSLGPQYVVSAFNVFVCTVCSGIHRQFGHRVKGVSMSTFKSDEVAALRESGNEKFSAFFLNKWTSAALPKPVEREAPRIQTWISAVYQDRRFYAEPAGWAPGSASASSGGTLQPSRSVAGSTSASEAAEPAVRPLHEVLGSDTPKLQVQHSSGGAASRQLDRSVSAASSSAGAATPVRSATMPAASSSSVTPAAAARQVNLLDVSSPKSARSAPPGALPAPAAAWDPFGAASPTAGAATAAPPAASAPTESSPAPAAQQPGAPAPAEAGWAAFGDAFPPEALQQPAAAAPAAAALAPVAPAAEGTSASGWEAFGDGPAPTPAPAGAAAPTAAASAAVPVPAATAPAAPAAAAVPSTSAGSSPGKPSRQPVRSGSRPEVPMDVFFPEFEQIRATGMLPNGQPVPLPAFAHSYSGLAQRGSGSMPGQLPPPPQHPQAAHANPYAAGAAYGSYPAATVQQQPYGAGYGAAPQQRPTIAIPPAPLHPGGYYAGMSPAGYPGMPSPGPGPYSSPSGYSPAGSAHSPAGSAFSAASQHGPPTNGGAYGGSGHADLRSSTGSLGEAMPGGSAAPTPAAAAPHDPFAGLAPGLRAALPAVPGTGSGKWGGGAAPPPTPAGMPPYANGSGAVPPAATGAATGSPFGTYPAAGQFAGAPAPSPAGLPPATAAASATLFGRAPSLTGYDLSAPAAPKPQATGNPFA